jgi:hypothetical protein
MSIWNLPVHQEKNPTPTGSAGSARYGLTLTEPRQAAPRDACSRCTVELNPDGTCPQCDRAPESEPDNTGAELTEQTLADLIGLSLEGEDVESELTELTGGEHARVITFGAAGLLTGDAGIVVHFGRAVFHLTVQRVK